MSHSNHNTIPLKCNLDGNIYPIDSNIVDLISLLWDVGIDLSQSCELDTDHNGYIWIQMSNIPFCKFMSIMYDYTNNNKKMYDLFCTHGDSKLTYEFNIYDRRPYVIKFPENFGDLNKYQKPYCDIDINCNVYISPDLKDDVIKQLIIYKDYSNTDKPLINSGITCNIK